MQGRGITTAKRKKRATVRKTKSQKVKAAKKPVKRATSGKSRRTTKRVAAKPSRKDEGYGAGFGRGERVIEAGGSIPSVMRYFCNTQHNSGLDVGLDTDKPYNTRTL